jgi:GTP-binding protein Era
MNRTAAAALADSDLALFVVEALKWTGEDQLALERLKSSGRPAIAVVNKVDRVHPRERLLPYLAELAARQAFADIVPVSAQKSSNLEALLRVTLAALPERPMFPPEQFTDRSLAFRIAESIPKLTLRAVVGCPAASPSRSSPSTGQPGRRGLGRDLVDREGQKPIVIGAGGERLKRIGRAARTELNRMFDRRFHLTLWVKVRENWADDARALASLGIE